MHQRSSSRRAARERKASSSEVVEDLTTIDALVVLDALSIRQRAVLILIYWYDQDQQSTAEMLGITRGAVARHLARAHARLREILDNDIHA